MLQLYSFHCGKTVRRLARRIRRSDWWATKKREAVFLRCMCGAKEARARACDIIKIAKLWGVCAHTNVNATHDLRTRAPVFGQVRVCDGKTEKRPGPASFRLLSHSV